MRCIIQKVAQYVSKGGRGGEPKEEGAEDGGKRVGGALGVESSEALGEERSHKGSVAAF